MQCVWSVLLNADDVHKVVHPESEYYILWKSVSDGWREKGSFHSLLTRRGNGVLHARCCGDLQVQTSPISDE